MLNDRLEREMRAKPYDARSGTMTAPMYWLLNSKPAMMVFIWLVPAGLCQASITEGTW